MSEKLEWFPIDEVRLKQVNNGYLVTVGDWNAFVFKRLSEVTEFLSNLNVYEPEIIPPGHTTFNP